jgi:hypothetical protein
MPKKTIAEDVAGMTVGDVMLDHVTGNPVKVLELPDADGWALVECEAVALKGPYKIPAALRLMPMPVSLDAPAEA